VIANYHKLTKSTTGYYKMYEEVDWSLVVCDEAHFFRNAKTQTAISTFTLRRQMGLLITGTYKHHNKQQIFLIIIAFRHTCTELCGRHANSHRVA
jgi:hypothetical protein